MKISKGFTLIEVLIGVTLVSLIAVGMISVVMLYAKNAARSSARQEVSELSNLLQLTLSNDDACREALRDLASFDGNATSIDHLYNGAAGLIAQTRTRYGTHLWIKGIVVENRPGAEPIRNIVIDNVDQSLQTYTTNVVVRLTEYTSDYVTAPTVDSNNADQLAPITIPVKIFTNGAGVVQRCLLLSSNNQTCNALGGTFDHSEGKCVFPKCDAVEAARPEGGGDCPAPGATICSTPNLYFWGHVRDDITRVTRLVCMCTNSCLNPPPPTPY